MSQLEKTLLPYALATVVTASLVEAFWISRRRAYDWKAFGVSALDQLLRQLLLVLLPITIAAPAVRWAQTHRLTTISLHSLPAIVGLFIGLEFSYYWYHRTTHRVRWFWANHSIHHSPNQFNFSAAYRLGIFGKLIGAPFFFVPLIWLGFSVEGVFAALNLNLLYQFWIHAEWIPKLGWLEYVLNTPSAHRVHHASNLEYMDANYGGVLVIFDRLFGSYIEERDDLPCRYGLLHPQTSNNPLHVELDSWIGLAKDLARARSLGAALGYLFRAPGWRPDGPGETTAELRRRAALD